MTKHFALPLPKFASDPKLFWLLALLHLYLAFGHLAPLIAGQTTWENFWKSGGALLAVYWFAALALNRRDPAG